MNNNDLREGKGVTTWIDNDVRILIKDKQNEIFSKTRKNVSMQFVTSEAVKKGINLIDI